MTLSLVSAALPAAAVPTRADTVLLKQAVATLEHIPTLSLHSTLVTISMQPPTGRHAALKGTLQMQARFTRAADGRFRCVIWIKQDGRWTTLYETVGDGRRVWTYAAQLHQYVIVPEAEYRRPNILGQHLMKLGLLGALLAGGDAPGEDVLSDTATLAARQGQSSVVLLNGHRFSVVTLDLGPTGTLRLLLNPVTARLQQLTFTGKGPQAHFSVTETVERQSASPALPAALFEAGPPVGALPAPPGVQDFLP